MDLQGVGIGRGIAIGPIRRMPQPLPDPQVASHAGAAAELARTRAALAAVAAELLAAGERAGRDARAVLGAQAMMAEDPTALADIAALIEEGSTGERAVFDVFAAVHRQLGDAGGLVADRAADVRDVSRRVIARLRGVAAPGIPVSDEPYILVATDLAPADTALLDLGTVLAFVTSEGSATSHTAILARQRSIPAIVGAVGAADLREGSVAIVDAASGTITTDPSPAALAAARARRASRAAATTPLAECTLADGTRIPLLANLGSPVDAAAAVALGAEGVGLFRTELLFLDAAVAPGIPQQQAAYIELLGHFPGRTVVVRVLDAGADKPLAFLGSPVEPNPALGMRGLRALRAHEQVLRDQLQALAAAQDATTADLRVMAPMVADAAEAEWFVELAKSLGLRTVGVMAEVPSLALLADKVFAVSDFVSIGTNDLTQYTLAADRMLGATAGYQDPWHPAVLRLVKLLGDAGAAAGKPVGVCGEAAADPALAVVLVGLGASSLSMSPSALADVRAQLSTITLEQAQAKAAAALGASTAALARVAASSA